jgi:hypothetical protein
MRMCGNQSDPRGEGQVERRRLYEGPVEHGKQREIRITSQRTNDCILATEPPPPLPPNRRDPGRGREEVALGFPFRSTAHRAQQRTLTFSPRGRGTRGAAARGRKRANIKTQGSPARTRAGGSRLGAGSGGAGGAAEQGVVVGERDYYIITILQRITDSRRGGRRRMGGGYLDLDRRMRRRAGRAAASGEGGGITAGRLAVAVAGRGRKVGSVWGSEDEVAAVSLYDFSSPFFFLFLFFCLDESRKAEADRVGIRRIWSVARPRQRQSCGSPDSKARVLFRFPRFAPHLVTNSGSFFFLSFALRFLAFSQVDSSWGGYRVSNLVLDFF